MKCFSRHQSSISGNEERGECGDKAVAQVIPWTQTMIPNQYNQNTVMSVKQFQFGSKVIHREQHWVPQPQNATYAECAKCGPAMEIWWLATSGCRLCFVSVFIVFVSCGNFVCFLLSSFFYQFITADSLIIILIIIIIIGTILIIKTFWKETTIEPWERSAGELLASFTENYQRVCEQYKL